jgi:hypothetical protein
LQAQSRKCRLYPTSVEYPTIPSTFTTTIRTPTASASTSKRKELSTKLHRTLQHLPLTNPVSKGPEPYVRSDHREQEASSSSVKNTKPIHTLAAAESDVKVAKEEIKVLKSQLKDVKRTGSPAQSNYSSRLFFNNVLNSRHRTCTDSTTTQGRFIGEPEQESAQISSH